MADALDVVMRIIADFAIWPAKSASSAASVFAGERQARYHARFRFDLGIATWLTSASSRHTA
jgi:hypothetical protein